MVNRMIICSLLFLGMLLFFPEAAISGSKYGAALWLSELLPTLLPFFIALRLFQCCLPRVANHRAFLLLGLLCGYPTGATLVADQYSQGRLRRSQAYFYLGFVNNPSPMFILAFCGVTILHMTTPASFCFFSLIILAGLAGSLLFYFLFRRILDKNISAQSSPSSVPSTKSLPHALSQRLDAIILDSFVLVTKIGGYVILFCILGQFICRFLSPSNISGILCLGSLEITSGISYLKISSLTLVTKKVLAASLLAFGGLSAAAQTSSVLTQSGLSILPYILNKFLNAGLAGLLCFLFIRFL